MVDLIKLAYLGARGPVDDWRAFGADLHGMQPVMDGKILRLRMDEQLWRFQIDPEGKPGCEFLGFEWASHAAYESMLDRVRKAGYDIVEDSNLARERGVERLARMIGPVGFQYEFCTAQISHSSPFISPNGVKFVTGDLGMGHMALLVEDQAKSDKFFMETLGMRHTDSFTTSIGVATFMRGSPRHHIMATLPAMGAKEGLHHVYVEVSELHMLGRAWDKVEAGAARVFASIGQHTNDPAISYYCQTPSGFGFEYGWDSLIVDDENWTPKHWGGGDQWGHKGLPANA